MICKSFAYIIRCDRLTPQLLVFESLEEPGFEAPKGAQKGLETPLQTALRESHEETGLRDLHPLAVLGEQLWQDERQTFVLLEAPPGLPERFDHVVTGEDMDAGWVYRFRWLELQDDLETRLVQGSDAFLPQLRAYLHSHPG